MDTGRFYGQKRVVVRPIPEEFEDSELSSEEEDISSAPDEVIAEEGSSTDNSDSDDEPLAMLVQSSGVVC